MARHGRDHLPVADPETLDGVGANKLDDMPDRVSGLGDSGGALVVGLVLVLAPVTVYRPGPSAITVSGNTTVATKAVVAVNRQRLIPRDPRCVAALPG